MLNNDNKYLLTNRRNILSIMSGGVIGASDVYSKYGNDILSASHGYLPLFVNGVPEEAIKLTSANIDTNFPVLLEIDLDSVSKEIHRYHLSNGKILDESNLDNSDAEVILINEVIKTSLISCVHFMTHENLQDFKARVLENVPVNNFKYNVSPELFYINQTKFNVNWFSLVPTLNTVSPSLAYRSRLSDKIVASIALLSENLKRSDDAILLMSLIQSSDINDNVSVPYEYRILSNVINLLHLDISHFSNTSENHKLIRATIEVLIGINLEEGWDATDVLDEIVNVYNSISGEVSSENIDNWRNFCKDVLNNEKDIYPGVLSDVNDIIKRSIFLLLIRPEYSDYVDIESEYLNPGHAVKTIALFFAGFRAGYERLSNDFKSYDEYHGIFSPLKVHYINLDTTEENRVFPASANISVICDINSQQYRCKLQVLEEVLTDKSVSLPNEVHTIINRMNQKGYKETKYDMFENRVSYSFEYQAEARRQPIYIDIYDHMMRISSPCIEFKKYKSYERKYTTKKVMEQLLKDNGIMQGKCYYVYEKGVNISLERRISLSDINNLNIIDIIEFIAKSSDNFEKEYFKHDKVQ